MNGLNLITSFLPQNKTLYPGQAFWHPEQWLCPVENVTSSPVLLRLDHSFMSRPVVQWSSDQKGDGLSNSDCSQPAAFQDNEYSCHISYQSSQMLIQLLWTRVLVDRPNQTSQLTEQRGHKMWRNLKKATVLSSPFHGEQPAAGASWLLVQQH